MLFHKSRLTENNSLFKVIRATSLALCHEVTGKQMPEYVNSLLPNAALPFSLVQPGRLLLASPPVRPLQNRWTLGYYLFGYLAPPRILIRSHI